MKYLVYAALAFVAALLFLPSPPGTGIRNLPLLIAILSLIVLHLLIRAGRRIVALIRTKSALQKAGFTVEKCALIPNVFGVRGQYDIVATNGYITVKIVVTVRKRAYLRYHFDSAARLELYRSNRVMFTVKHQGPVRRRGFVETKRAGVRRLPYPREGEEGVIYALILDRLPYAVTDASKREGQLSVGERICGLVYLYTPNHLDDFIQEVVAAEKT